MTGMRDPESGGRISDVELVWAADHLGELRRSVSEHRFRNRLLWSSLAIGLAAHVLGYLLKSSGPGEPVAVLADLLYTLGWALWTGVVVVALIEIIPAVKERQMSRALDVYEAALRSRARANDNGPGAALDTPSALGECIATSHGEVVGRCARSC